MGCVRRKSRTGDWTGVISVVAKAPKSAASRLLGYTREEFMVTPISQIHPHELPQMQAFLDRALRDGVNWTIEMACRTKSGTFLPTEIELLALDSGGRVYVISLVRDRSEHRG